MPVVSVGSGSLSAGQAGKPGFHFHRKITWKFSPEYVAKAVTDDKCKRTLGMEVCLSLEMCKGAWGLAAPDSKFQQTWV